jgi:hypothetical protein
MVSPTINIQFGDGLYHPFMIEGSLEVKVWTDENQRWEESEKRREEERESLRRKKIRCAKR